MATHPKVSVILSSYNHAKYLREAIESALGQTYSDFELIIWDDASTDDSWNIISSYTDSRIRKFRNENNELGQYLQRAILDTSSGEYIAIHHSDDIWEHQKLEKQVAFLDTNPNIGAVFTNVLMVGEENEALFDDIPLNQTVFDQPNRSRYEWLNYFFYTGNALAHPSVVIRKACYVKCGTYRPGFVQLPDFDLWVRLCMTYDIHVLPEKLLRLRIRANEMNASANRPDTRIRRQFEILKILDNFRNITTFDELRLIFPEAEKFTEADDADTGFILGMLSVEAETFYGNLTRLFGLTLLFEALNDPNRAGRVAQLYNFNQQEFFKLSAKYDIFSIELSTKVAAQSLQLTENEQRISALNETNSNLTLLLAEIQNSRAWKLITAYREIQAKIISALSYRAK